MSNVRYLCLPDPKRSFQCGLCQPSRALHLSHVLKGQDAVFNHCTLSVSDLHSIESREGNLPFQRHSCLVHLKPLQPSKKGSY